MKSYKHLYNLSLNESLGGKSKSLHFAAHSHHPWPDCTLKAHEQYWKDSSSLLDAKWNKVFGEVIPRVQKNIAKTLNLSHPEMIALAPNTHEFVVRIFSCFNDKTQKIKVLTTDSEFHSFRRQLNRLIEAEKVEAIIVPVEPYNTFQERWAEEVQKNFDLIFISQVFFNSGLTCPDLGTWVSKAHKNSMIVVDGYHAFCAIPTDLKQYENRIFYVAGGYKYAQSGEGVCFLAVPKGCSLRPISTGWFASFETLNLSQNAIHYSDNGMRFFGATFDASGCYRFNAVMEMFEKEKLPVEVVHQRVNDLKKYFYEKMSAFSFQELNHKNIILDKNKMPDAHFVTFVTPKANEIEEVLAQNNIVVDSRGDRLRFGFGLYHDLKDIDQLMNRLHECMR